MSRMTSSRMERETLKRLEHEYSEVEAIQVFVRKIKELTAYIGSIEADMRRRYNEKNKNLHIELGELRSEVARLEHELAEAKKPAETRTSKQWRRDEFIKHQDNQIKQLSNKIAELRPTVIPESKWKDKYFSLLAHVRKGDVEKLNQIAQDVRCVEN